MPERWQVARLSIKESPVPSILMTGRQCDGRALLGKKRAALPCNCRLALAEFSAQRIQLFSKSEMSRLTRYLVGLFWSNALLFAGVASVLIWLIQCLRVFDVVSVKGQNLLTLVGQAVLTMPPLLIVFLYVCLGIGMGRALRDLQISQELHAIHSSRRLGALFGAVGVFIALGAMLLLLLTNVLEPMAQRRLSEWQASIAADLVGRTLRPHRFSEVTPGVVIVIGGRQGVGEITDFFVDDSRDPKMRRTYIAKSANVSQDENGYVLNLRDGYLQYTTDQLAFSQITFSTYDVSLDRLTDPVVNRDPLAESSTFDIVREGLSTGVWSEGAINMLINRSAEGLRIVGICLLVAALAGFPTGKRLRLVLPLEATVLAAAFGERLVATYFPGMFAPYAGAVVMILVSLVILAVKLRVDQWFGGIPKRMEAQS